MTGNTSTDQQVLGTAAMGGLFASLFGFISHNLSWLILGLTVLLILVLLTLRFIKMIKEKRTK